MTKQLTSSQYIDQERRAFALYTLQDRAISAITDGLKPGGRRTIWMARNGEKSKTATLAGATMAIHPHGDASGSINTLTAPFGNNIPLYKGYGMFGTLLDPTSYGAARYTSVSISKFTDDVVLKDIEIIPMTGNYDNTIQEPVHFLPLVPICLINPSEGVAVGFASDILPRCIKDVITAQIAHLTTGKIIPMIPTFYPIKDKCIKTETTDRGLAYYFKGEVVIKSKTVANISKLPYGMSHAKITKNLMALQDSGHINDFTDRSRDIINIDVKFKHSGLDNQTVDTLIKMFGLEVRYFENLNVLDFTGEFVVKLTAQQIVEQFTDWRLTWYVARYERLKQLLLIDIQKYLDIKTAIDNNVGNLAKNISSRTELKTRLAAMSIVYVDYIADLPIYRFTAEEYQKNEKKLEEAYETLKYYEELLSDEDKRAKIYVTELQQILTNFTKGVYNGK